MAPDSASIAEKEKRQAAGSSVVAAVLLTLLKLIVGLITGSLGILSEAAHSGLDLVAALVTFFAVRLSDKPPDTVHTYGHGKVENLSALIETFLLLATCVWIIYEVVQRLFFKSVEVEASIWAFVVMIISIVVDVTRARVLYKAARKYGSQALEADALHFSTDVWSSMTVIVGLVLVRVGAGLGAEWEWLEKADAVAALIVALIVIYVSVQLGRRAIAVLLDAAPPGLAERIGLEVFQISGVEKVGPIRVRQSGASTFVDLTVGVDRSASLEEAHELATVVEHQVVELAPHSDVVVHVDPVQRMGESLHQTVNAVAGRMGLQTHKVLAREIGGAYYINLDVEVPGDLTLETAHKQVCVFEAALYQELSQIREINSHIEPIPAPVTRKIPGDGRRRQLTSDEKNHVDRVRTQVLAVVEEARELRSCHNLRVWPGRNGYEIVLHCLADPQLSIARVHHLSEELKRQLQVQVADIGLVYVHVEPENHP